MAEPTLKFYFDFSCPYAYLASTQIEAFAARVGARLESKPILLGGVFRARETPQNLSEVLAPSKARHNLADMQRQAAFAGVELRMPAGHPMRTVEALRSLLVVGPPAWPLVHALYRAYWVDGVEISKPENLRAILAEAGHDADAILAKISDPQIKQELRARTDEAIEAGVFGVPTFVVHDEQSGRDDELFWGVDRLDMVAAEIAARTGAPARSAPELPAPRAPVDVWFDYSSPFAYLGCHRAEALLGDHANWRPMLLGAVFKQVGTDDVPLFRQSPAKRRHTALDLERQARMAGAPYRFPSNFPLRSVLALRVTLASGALEGGAEGRELIHQLFRAYWAEDRDIADPAVVAQICDDCGLDGAALVEAAGQAAIKQALRDSTEAAVEAGVFGAPTFVVHTDAGPKLFWGGDRLELAMRAAAGDTRAYPELA